MRALIQRVDYASVTVAGEVVGKVDKGLLVLLGVTDSDTAELAERLAQKVSKLRIFNDQAGKMNLSVQDVAGGVLVVSQFTLYADARKGNRPSYISAAEPEVAIPIYEHFADTLASLGLTVARGEFGANMDVALLNQGPVTIWLDTDKLF
jgi:D-tyrosyl-tRNA(Tyr) deacylase